MRRYYARVNLSSGKVVGISSRPTAEEGQEVIELDADLAVKLLDGREALDQWVLAGPAGARGLHKLQATSKARRVDLLPITEVQIQPPGTPPPPSTDVTILVDRVAGELLLSYNGERVKALARPIKIYATREGDPAYLKCAISLDVNILNSIALHNGLSRWPNPLRVKLADGTTDLSLFTAANHNVVAIETA